MGKLDKGRLGRNLRRLRKAAKLSQRELAERVGFSRQGIASVEAGSRTLALGPFVAVCRVLGCSADQLLAGVA